MAEAVPLAGKVRTEWLGEMVAKRKGLWRTDRGPPDVV